MHASAAKCSVTPSQIAAFRLSRHHLLNQGAADLVTVCRDVGGIQAQLMVAAEMALWARNHKISRTQIHDALWREHSLIKTASLRGTLHLIPADEFSVYITALRNSRVASAMRIMSRFNITPKEASAMNNVILEELGDGPVLQRGLTKRIRPKVSRNIRRCMDKVWSVFRLAIAEGLVCCGPERGVEVTLVRTDQWLPRQKRIEEQEAKRILLRRYLSAYGPATVRDFSHWTGMSMKESREAWDSMQDELVEVTVEDHRTWLLRHDLEDFASSNLDGSVLRLLPHFDCYLLAHSEKEHLVGAGNYKRVYRSQGWISPVILLDGRVVGTWSYKRRGQRLTTQIELFEKIPKLLQGRIKEETDSLERFMQSKSAASGGVKTKSK
jgi:uncharacterized protein YcaQ